jgi:lipid-binding SYLF domain-containing protein
MEVRKLIAIAAGLVASAPALAADAAAERQEIRKMCDAALAVLKKENPSARAHAARAAGYGCFSQFGLSIIFGGAGGRGLVHDNATNRDIYMAVAQVSAGPEIGAKHYREVLVFDDATVLHRFVDSGWELAGSGGAIAKLEGKGGDLEGAGTASTGISIYPMTSTGLAFGGSAAGRKYWKSFALN